MKCNKKTKITYYYVYKTHMNWIKSVKSNIGMPRAMKKDGLFAYVNETVDHADWILADIYQQYETILNTIPRNPG